MTRSPREVECTFRQSEAMTNKGLWVKRERSKLKKRRKMYYNKDLIQDMKNSD